MKHTKIISAPISKDFMDEIFIGVVILAAIVIGFIGLFGTVWLKLDLATPVHAIVIGTIAFPPLALLLYLGKQQHCESFTVLGAATALLLGVFGLFYGLASF